MQSQKGLLELSLWLWLQLWPTAQSQSPLKGHLALYRSAGHRGKAGQAEVVGAAHCPGLRLSWRVVGRRRLWLRGFGCPRRSSKHRLINFQVGFTWGKLRCPKEQGPPGGGEGGSGSR